VLGVAPLLLGETAQRPEAPLAHPASSLWPAVFREHSEENAFRQHIRGGAQVIAIPILIAGGLLAEFLHLFLSSVAAIVLGTLLTLGFGFLRGMAPPRDDINHHRGAVVGLGPLGGFARRARAHLATVS
jgi:hypothetical protein